MRTGRIETDIRSSNADANLPFINDLIAAKQTDKIELPTLDWDYHGQPLECQEANLKSAFELTQLREQRDTAAVYDWLVRLRLNEFAET